MITNLQIEYLEAGALPIYEGSGLQQFYAVGDMHNPPQLDIRPVGPVIVPLEIDTSLDELESKLQSWIGCVGEEDCSILFPIRGVIRLERVDTEAMVNTAVCVCGAHLYDTTDAHEPNCPVLNRRREPNVWVLAGMALLPGVQHGTPLNGESPIPAILEACEQWLRPEGMTTEELLRRPTVDGLRRPTADALNRMREAAAEQRAVEARALKLLLEGLDPQQQADWIRYGVFHVHSLDGYTYVIQPGQGHNVFRIEEGVRTVEYCIVTEGYTPTHDLMLAQKLLLEHNPASFFEKANSWKLD